MQTTATPQRVLGFYDRTFWELMSEKKGMWLQRCHSCHRFRYPPAALCPDCLSEDSQWMPVSGLGHVLSWTVFHRMYLPEYPAPYNVVSVQLDEGPIMISNLKGDIDVRNSIGLRVRASLDQMDDGVILPRFVLTNSVVSR